jgi:hypothetical protein
MRAIGTLAHRMVVALAILMGGCAAHHPAATPTQSSYTVIMGVGSAYYTATCGYEAFFKNESGGGSGGIVKIDTGALPPGDPLNPTSEPTKGATLTGNFDGFGKRVIKDASANMTYTVNVVYHADNVDAIVNRMTVLGC